MMLDLQHLRVALPPFTLELDARFNAPVTGISGPSGAGKTTLLDLIAGLRRPHHGRIRLGDRLLDDPAARLHVPARHRRIGYLPQDLALFPHLSVESNLRYGCRNPAAPHSPFGFNHVVEVLEIAPLVSRGIAGLSGGEKQRVALARALLASPEFLLLDEPLASLDDRLKERILPLLRRVPEEFGVPILYVSHDQSELRTLCDEVHVLASGRLACR